MKISNIADVSNHIVSWLHEQIMKSHTKGFTLGVSGGIDSAVVSMLCAMTGLPVIVVEMPIHQNKEQVNLAQNHIHFLKNKFPNVSSLRVDLTDTYDGLTKELMTSIIIPERKYNKDRDSSFYDQRSEDRANSARTQRKTEQEMLTTVNIRSRLRMVTLYGISGLNKMLVCGTGNKVEDFGIGFYTKYGDGGVDISPIADLMKSEVYRLGEYLKVSQDILNIRPTDGLWDDGRTDEDQIGATYDELEWAMWFISENWYWETGMENHPGYLRYDPEELTDRQKEVLEIYQDRHNNNKHKMESIPVCKIGHNFYK